MRNSQRQQIRFPLKVTTEIVAKWYLLIQEYTDSLSVLSLYERTPLLNSFPYYNLVEISRQLLAVFICLERFKTCSHLSILERGPYRNRRYFIIGFTFPTVAFPSDFVKHVSRCY